MIFANATVVFFARSSNEPMQPTQYSTSGRSFRAAISAIVGMSSPSAHFARSPGSNAHGEPRCSIDSNAGITSSGKRDSPSTRLRRSSRITLSWSIDTGHSCTHARQVVQLQSSSSVM